MNTPPHRHIRTLAAALVVTLVFAGTACAPAPATAVITTTTTTTTTTTAPPCPSTYPVMAKSRANAAQLVAWFHHVKPNAQLETTVSIDTLAWYYINEGDIEGVSGEIAFVQAVLETGWFSFPSGGQVRPGDNNFAGIGAVDGGNAPNRFSSAQLGVRAQIHHLRRYADPAAASASVLANPVASPRFHLVNPAGKARDLSQFGSGNWATDTAYNTRLITLYNQLLTHSKICTR